ncbi:MAG: hypothetical protein CMM58_10110 [Rhodospirillaceae bacterium]|nr:hypothetical protein [Rhodospirillaceae bacterium]|tara:strand:+ start:520 stop:1044 length:525 start_codon:yes stop_codon:yes gene_type:complete
MIWENILGVVQICSGIAVIASVIYLAREVSQTTRVVRAQFGHGLTSRLYERYFLSAKDKEFSQFLSKDWSNDELENYEYWRITLWINTILVDLFDTYDQHRQKLVDSTHLNMRITLLKTGLMRTKMGEPTWRIWKQARDPEFVNWFEMEFFGHRLEDSKDGGNIEWENLNMKKE